MSNRSIIDQGIQGGFLRGVLLSKLVLCLRLHRNGIIEERTCGDGEALSARHLGLPDSCGNHWRGYGGSGERCSALMVITRMGFSRLDKAIVIPVWQMVSSAGLETERAHSLKRPEGERRALVRVLLIYRHPRTCA